MTLPIRLDHFLKFRGFAQTGGHAKLLIQDGEVHVNGEVETRRRRKLNAGDIISCQGREEIVQGSK
ncbi:MAG: RNA-binding protein [Deltaproteobacteria bacterium]|nr:RNA-binding protein [Deltaproteobacteria bacterium]